MPKRPKWKHSRPFREYLALKIMHDLGMVTTEDEIRAMLAVRPGTTPSLNTYTTKRFSAVRNSKHLARILAAITELEATIE